MDGLEIGKPALAVVDMQNDFVDDDVGSYAIGAERMVTRIGRVIAAARRAQVPIVFSQEVHRADGLDGGRLLWDGRSGWVTGKHPSAACRESRRHRPASRARRASRLLTSWRPSLATCASSSGASASSSAPSST